MEVVVLVLVGVVVSLLVAMVSGSLREDGSSPVPACGTNHLSALDSSRTKPIPVTSAG
jgi:hypothetical protein